MDTDNKTENQQVEAQAEYAQRAAAVFNRCGKLSVREEGTDGEILRSPGLGLTVIQNPHGRNTRRPNRKPGNLDHVGLQRPEAHSKVWAKGMYYVNTYIVREPDEVAEAMEKNPGGDYLQYAPNQHMLIIACGFNRQGIAGKRFVEAVWAEDKEKYDGDLHPFVFLQDIQPYLNDDGKNCVREMMARHRFNPACVIFLPVDHSVNGRQGWWSLDLTKTAESFIRKEITDTEEIDLAEELGTEPQDIM